MCWECCRLMASVGGVSPESMDMDLSGFPLLAPSSGGFPLAGRFVLLSRCNMCELQGWMFPYWYLNSILRSVDIYYKCLSLANNL